MKLLDKRSGANLGTELDHPCIQVKGMIDLAARLRILLLAAAECKLQREGRCYEGARRRRMSKTFISDDIRGVLMPHQPVNRNEPELARRSGALVKSIEQVIEGHKVVSFDVFDTLLARRVERPTDVFEYLGNVFNLPEFQAARIKAEELARKRYGKAGCPEITLEQIYGILKDILPSMKFGPSEELAAEQKFLFADPTIRIILDVARAKKKRVIAISDMYLSGEQISRLLVANGIEVDAVYSSADHRLAGLGKFNGRMFSFVAITEKVEAGDIVHFGDNVQADVINARLCGVTGVHIKSRRDEINSETVPFLRAAGKAKNFTTSLVRGQIAAKMPHLCTGSTSLFTYGYCYAGPLIAGFCTFLQRKVERDNIDKLVLLARDGYVIERALHILKLKLPPYEVMPISRRMAILPVLNEDRGLVERTLFAALSDGLTPRAYWQSLDLDNSIIAGREDVDRGMSRMDFLSRYSEALQDVARSERKLLEKHLQTWIGADPGKTALVDVGWGLTTIRAIDTVIGDRYRGYFLGQQASVTIERGFPATYLTDKRIPMLSTN